jgi:hypothetical protein
MSPKWSPNELLPCPSQIPWFDIKIWFNERRTKVGLMTEVHFVDFCHILSHLYDFPFTVCACVCVSPLPSANDLHTWCISRAVGGAVAAYLMYCVVIWLESTTKYKDFSTVDSTRLRVCVVFLLVTSKSNDSELNSVWRSCQWRLAQCCTLLYWTLEKERKGSLFMSSVALSQGWTKSRSNCPPLD